MVTSAPSAAHCSSLSAEPAVVITRAPRAAASWIAIEPMPPAPPCTRNHSSRRRPPIMNTFDQTVHATSGRLAAVLEGHPGGHRHHLARGADDPLGVPAARQQRAALVADAPAGHAVADGRDGAAALEPEHVGGTGRRGVVALPLQQVGPVDGGRDDRDGDLAGTGLAGRAARRATAPRARPGPRHDRPHRPRTGRRCGPPCCRRARRRRCRRGPWRPEAGPSPPRAAGPSRPASPPPGGSPRSDRRRTRAGRC